MFRGLANVNVTADDVDAAVAWYSEVFGAAPYFVAPPEGPAQYAEWRLGDDEDEFGVMSSGFRPSLPTPGGAIAYLAVDDVDASVAALTERGATLVDAVTDRGDGFRTASIADPFGNLIGLMHSPHWLERHGG